MSRSKWKGFYIAFFKVELFYWLWDSNYNKGISTLCYDYNYKEEDNLNSSSIRRNVYLLKIFLNEFLTTYSGYEDIPLFIGLGHLGCNVSSFINTKELFITHMKNKKNKQIKQKQKKVYKKKINLKKK